MGRRTYYKKPKRLEKLSRNEMVDLSFDLINAFRLVKSPYETSLLIQDLLTASEIKNLAKRLRIAKLLLEGEKHRDIAKKLHCSLGTVSKVNIWLNERGEGFRKIIKKLPKRYDYPSKLPRKPIEFQLPQVLLATAQYALAKKQDKHLDKFMKGVDNKKSIDKTLRKYFNQQYKEKHFEKTRKSS
jgi:uncharacterized protein YerC